MHDPRVHAWIVKAAHFLSEATNAAKQLPPDAEHLARGIREAIAVAAVATLGMPDELRGDIAAAHALLYRRRFPKEHSYLLFAALSELRDYFVDLDRIAKSAGYSAPMGESDLPREFLVSAAGFLPERDSFAERLQLLLKRVGELQSAESSPLDVLCDPHDVERRQSLQKELLENVGEAFRAKATIGLALAQEDVVDMLGLSHSLSGIARTTRALAAVVNASDTLMSTRAARVSLAAVATGALAAGEGEAVVARSGFGGRRSSAPRTTKPEALSEESNPFSAGNSFLPPFGRLGMLARAQSAIDRLQSGRASRHPLFLGLRGVGKTTLLEILRAYADGKGLLVIRIEADEDAATVRSLASGFRSSLLQLEQRQSETGKETQRAHRALRGFLSQIEGGSVISLGAAPQPGIADSGDLTTDMTDLFVEVGRAAQALKSAIVLFVDEFQNLETKLVTAIITALHRVSLMGLPIGFVGAGLPNLAVLVGEAKSYAERLFDFVTVGPLSLEETRQAIAEPARALGVEFEDAAVRHIYEATRGYPYFVQQWAQSAWDAAPQSPISLADAQAAGAHVLKLLDDSFFKVRVERLTASELRYIAALAHLGPGPQSSTEVASALNASSQALAQVRARLISKGVIFSPSHRRIEFTVPLFDDFVRRNIVE